MPRTVRLRELLLGVEGLALLRHLHDGDDAAAAARVEEVRRIVDDPVLAAGEPTVEAAPRDGYAAWAPGYDDDPDNIVIALEEPALWSRIADVAPGRALDAGCGTGRHARRLVDLGHDVVGVDLTPEMIDRARGRVPEARFLEGDLRALPLPDAAFDLVVCGLALAHLPDLSPAVAELARVLRPGGRLLVSVLHPFQALLGWHAPFRDAGGRRAFVREHAQAHADYLAAFAAHGLAVRGCEEPRMDAGHARAKRRAYAAVPEATVAAYAGLPAVLVWDVERA